MCVHAFLVFLLGSVCSLYISADRSSEKYSERLLIVLDVILFLQWTRIGI